MSDSSIKYETRAAIGAQIEQAQQLHGAARPGLTALSPKGLYFGIAVLVVLGAAINAASDRPDDQLPGHGATGALRPDVTVIGGAPHGAVIPNETMGRSAGISHASALLDPEEAQRRLCVTAENCFDVEPVVRRVDAVAQLPTTP